MQETQGVLTQQFTQTERVANPASKFSQAGTKAYVWAMMSVAAVIGVWGASCLVYGVSQCSCVTQVMSGLRTAMIGI